MEQRYERSNQIFAAAKRIIPQGVTGARLPAVPGRYPVYMQEAHGSHLWDVDGNEYIDWMSGYGCILLGHAYRQVDAAAIAQMKKGFISILPHPIQNDLAHVLIEIVPCAEMVRFFKTGTDATTAAVRMARIHTGRDHVIRWGYHGWTDWAASGFENLDAGVPQSTRELTLAFEYNNLDSLQEVFEKCPEQIACVIMMPFEVDLPEPGFLEGVKRICREQGAVLIFDEVRSGFRMAPGGAQEYFGVEPDLTALSKALANGYAVAAVVGRESVMQAAETGLFSATFFVSALEMAAAIATLNIVKRDGVIERLWSTGEKLQDGLREIVSQSSLNVQVVGVPPMPFLRFQLDDESLNEQAKIEFYAATARLGVYLRPGHHWFVNFSHSDDDVARTLDACAEALKVAEQAVG